jgi:hypothetical protein
MARKLIHADDSDLGRLHCDNPACGHVLPEPLPWSKALIGYPCPRCGSDMLTALDFKTTERMRRGVRLINRWFGWLGSERPTPGHKEIRFRIVNGKLVKNGARHVD